MLSNRRRRYVLHYLSRNGGQMSLSDLAERIAAWENGSDVADLTYKQRKRVYTSLHQTHLPKLDDASIVEYDREEGTITLADRAADLDRYLELVGEYGMPWGRCYLALSAGGLLALVAAWLNLFPFVPDLTLAGVVVALFAGAAGVHAYVARHNRLGGRNTPLDVPED